MSESTDSVNRNFKPLFTWRSAITESDLTPPTRLVALALSLHMNERGGSAFPGPALLASETGLHVSTVKERLRELECKGWIVCIERGGIKGRTRRANVYQACIPPGATGDPSPTAPGPDGDPSPTALAPVAHGDPSSSYELFIDDGAVAPDPVPKKKPSRATRIPDPFEVSDRMVEWVTDRCPGFDWERETEKFVNYWVGVSGHRGTKLDWVATWRKWMLDATDRKAIR